MKQIKTYEGSFPLLISALISYITISCLIPFHSLAFGENFSVFPTTSHPYGISYPEWTAKWWEWFISIPADSNHPLNDVTGASCARSQDGPVWFLAGSVTGSASRTCTIPDGKAILLPTINSECSTAEDQSLTTELDLRGCAISNASYFKNFEASIDGVSINNMTNYNVISPLFNPIFPQKAIFTAHAGPTQAVSAGNWVFISPLGPGTHNIHIKGESVDYTPGATNNYAQDVTYHVIVP